MQQHKTVVRPDGTRTELNWEVDLAAASAVQAWSRRAPALLEQELAEMAAYFPHWLLTLGCDDALLPCAQCGDVLIYHNGAARCAACATPMTPPANAQLLWTGHVPTLIRAGPALERRLSALAAADYPTVTAGDARYLLVPLTVAYPAQWPHVEPVVRYQSRFLQLLGMPSGVSSSHHMFGDGRACLYASGQWRNVTVRVVLQQRLVNHLASLIKIAAGVDPVEAFIGRIH